MRFFLKFGGQVEESDNYQNSIFIPPVTIGQGCVIVNSVIGPNVAIGEHSTLDRAIPTRFHHRLLFHHTGYRTQPFSDRQRCRGQERQPKPEYWDNTGIDLGPISGNRGGYFIILRGNCKAYVSKQGYRLFNIDIPLIQAGMIWASGWRLASAVSNAGGLACWAAEACTRMFSKNRFTKCKTATDKPFGVNVPSCTRRRQTYSNHHRGENTRGVYICGNPKTWTPLLKQHGITVVHVVSSSKFAIKAAEAGCDAVVAEGFEAGGHNGREETTSFVLIPSVVQAVDIPVIAAGGIATGRQMLAAMVLGASCFR